jgi:MFS superfamily sulfate permease-like transporter
MTRLLFQLVGTLLLTAWILHWLPYIALATVLLGLGWGMVKLAQSLHEESPGAPRRT